MDDKIRELAKRLHTLVNMEENGKTNYTGQDLNILERVSERSCNETLTERDIYEIERLVAKFL